MSKCKQFVKTQQLRGGIAGITLIERSKPAVNTGLPKMGAEMLN